INMARGGCVDEVALVAALEAGQIAGAGLDCTDEEPLSTDSPLWDFENVIITPHTAGETRMYESNVVDILMENITRLHRGEVALMNQVV
ncbi:MAG: NAD(P)-dependent oxidoreductase, partial [Chloroflexota bacterium]